MALTDSKGMMFLEIVALLTYVCHWGMDFEVSEAQTPAHSLFIFLLLADTDVALSVPSPAPGMPSWPDASCHGDRGLSL